MQYTHIYINKLFGLYDYKLDFNYENDDKLTILTGPNGYGKTTILTIINKLNPRELFYFYLLKFKSIEIGLNDESVIKIYPKYTDDKSNEGIGDTKIEDVKEVRFEWYDKNDNLMSFFMYNNQIISKAHRKSIYEWFLNDKVNNRNSEKDLLDNKAFNENVAKSLKQDGFLMQLEGIKSGFIKANRIYNEANEDAKQTPIQRVKNNLKKLLESANKEYLEQSQRIEKRFIQEILSCDNIHISEDECGEIAENVSRRYNDLIRFRLTDKIVIPEYVESKSFILYAYLKSLNEKIDQFGTLSEKLKLFEKLIKEKRFANKSISFSPQHGFLIVSDTNEFLNENLLSSGEQNEIILLYRLIFEIADNTTLLIDEPENSLHLVWQREVLNDIKQIAKIKNLQVIIATHSSSIVSMGEENTIDLYYLQKEQL